MTQFCHARETTKDYHLCNGIYMFAGSGSGRILGQTQCDYVTTVELFPAFGPIACLLCKNALLCCFEMHSIPADRPTSSTIVGSTHLGEADRIAAIYFISCISFFGLRQCQR